MVLSNIKHVSSEISSTNMSEFKSMEATGHKGGGVDLSCETTALKVKCI